MQAQCDANGKTDFCPTKAMIAHGITQVFTLIFCVVTIFAKRSSPVLVLLSVVVGTMSAWLLTRRDTYLPFLGYAAVPPTLIKDRFVPQNANVEAVIDVDAVDGTRVLYWGARPSKEVKPTPWKAYDDWSNAGVAVVKDKRAVVIFHCPGEYEVSMRGKLERHIHYRTCGGAMGLLGPVQTAFVKC